MSQKPETKIVNDIIEWIEKHDGNAFHVHGSPMQRQGEPDIIGVMPVMVHRSDINANATVFISLGFEVKQPGETAETIQFYRLTQWSKNRWCAGVVHSVEEAERLVSQFVIDMMNNKFAAIEPKETWFSVGIAKNASG